MNLRPMRARIRAVTRYRHWPPLLFYADGKIVLDPAYTAAVHALRASPRPLLDIGCGIGLLVSFLRALEYSAPVLGLDADPRKIRLAGRAVGDANTRFVTADARNLPDHSGDVVMLDVLHYFDDAEQQSILQQIIARVAPGGVALIRVTLAEPSWRFAATRLEEWIIHRVRWIPWAGSNFPTREEIRAPFRAAGFADEVRPMWGWTPFNSYLFTFRRPALS